MPKYGHRIKQRAVACVECRRHPSPTPPVRRAPGPQCWPQGIHGANADVVLERPAIYDDPGCGRADLDPPGPMQGRGRDCTFALQITRATFAGTPPDRLNDAGIGPRIEGWNIIRIARKDVHVVDLFERGPEPGRAGARSQLQDKVSHQPQSRAGDPFSG
jgi:hypothetical protein